MPMLCGTVLEQTKMDLGLSRHNIAETEMLLQHRLYIHSMNYTLDMETLPDWQ